MKGFDIFVLILLSHIDNVNFNVKSLSYIISCPKPNKLLTIPEAHHT